MFTTTNYYRFKTQVQRTFVSLSLSLILSLPVTTLATTESVGIIGNVRAYVSDLCSALLKQNSARLSVPPRPPKKALIDTLTGFPPPGGSDTFELYSRWGSCVAHVAALVNNGTLRFDIGISGFFQGRGLYADILHRVLEGHSNVTAIPAEMAFDESDNAAAFLMHLTGFADFDLADSALIAEMGDSQQIQQLTAFQIATFRQRVIDAYFYMPGAKARAKNGFAQLVLLTIRPGHWIAFDVIKGPENPLNDVKIFIETNDHFTYELTPVGSAVPSDRAMSMVRSDYIRTKNVCD